MWILIAAVCGSLEANACIPMIYPEAFVNEELCIQAIPEALTRLPEGAVYAMPSCKEVPGEPA